MSGTKVLFLGPTNSEIPAWLETKGDLVTLREDPISATEVRAASWDFLISYGYRHILQADILDQFPDRAINLHISYLPWNRGADPNLWSFIDDTPKGVSIHYLDEGIDTGDLIAQQLVDFNEHSETLATTYAKLHDAICNLFKDNWDDIRRGACQRKRQAGEGSSHRARDKASVAHLLTQGWNTPVAGLYSQAHGKNS